METYIYLLFSFLFFILLPTVLILQIRQKYHAQLSKFYKELNDNQLVVVEHDSDIKQARIKKITGKIVYLTLASGRDVSAPIENVFPINHFLDENGFLDITNHQVA